MATASSYEQTDKKLDEKLVSLWEDFAMKRKLFDESNADLLTQIQKLKLLIQEKEDAKKALEEDSDMTKN